MGFNSRLGLSYGSGRTEVSDKSKCSFVGRGVTNICKDISNINNSLGSDSINI